MDELYAGAKAYQSAIAHQQNGKQAKVSYHIDRFEVAVLQEGNGVPVTSGIFMFDVLNEGDICVVRDSEERTESLAIFIQNNCAGLPIFSYNIHIPKTTTIYAPTFIKKTGHNIYEIAGTAGIPPKVDR